MRNSYYRLIHYSQIHPIRFWGFTSILILFFIFILSYFIYKFFQYQKKEAVNNLENNTKIQKNLENNFEKNSENNPVEQKSFFQNYKMLIGIILIQLFIIFGLIIGFSYDNLTANKPENLAISSSKYIFGIDISHYQGRINWTEMRTSHHPIKYIFIRATMGKDG